MKALLALFAILSLNVVFSQDDESHDTLYPIYYLDSTYLKYKFSGNIFTCESLRPTEDLLYENNYIRVATDEDISFLITDSLNVQYGSNRVIKINSIRKTLYKYLDKIAIDSNANILFVRVVSTCQPCTNSIINEINNNKNIILEMKHKHFKYVNVNYIQTTGDTRMEFIIVKVKIKFKKSSTFVIYGEKD